MKTQTFRASRDQISHSLIINFEKIPQGMAYCRAAQGLFFRRLAPHKFLSRAAVETALKKWETLKILPDPPLEMHKAPDPNIRAYKHFPLSSEQRVFQWPCLCISQGHKYCNILCSVLSEHKLQGKFLAISYIFA